MVSGFSDSRFLLAPRFFSLWEHFRKVRRSGCGQRWFCIWERINTGNLTPLTKEPQAHSIGGYSASTGTLRGQEGGVPVNRASVGCGFHILCGAMVVSAKSRGSVLSLKLDSFSWGGEGQNTALLLNLGPLRSQACKPCDLLLRYPLCPVYCSYDLSTTVH